MLNRRGPKPKWTKEAIIKDSLKYTSIKQWGISSPGAYGAFYRLKLPRHLIGHMKRKDKVLWDLDMLLKDALKYSTRAEWCEKSFKAYHFAYENGLLEQIYRHLPPASKIRKWSKEAIRKDALKYKTRSSWCANSPGAYDAAKNGKFLDEVCEHMSKISGFSKPERDVFLIIKDTYPKAQANIKFQNKDPNHSAKKLELDIYIPELRKGIEFNGSYWHTPQGLKRGRPKWSDASIANYHEYKEQFFKNRGIEILTITEAEWKIKKDECISRIMAFLSRTEPQQS